MSGDGGGEWGERTVVLVHGIRMLSPGLEVVFVKGEFLRERLDVRGIFVEENLFHCQPTNPQIFLIQQHKPSKRTYSSNPILESLQLWQRLVLPRLLRHSARVHQPRKRVNHHIPQLLMLSVQQHNQSRGLRIEGRGNGVDGRVDELFDLGVRDGGVLAELVDCAAGLGSVD